MAAKGETMFYRKNMGPKERAARLAAGGLMIVGAFALTGTLLVGLLVAGVASAATALVGFCPACALVGRKPVEGPRG
jgi:hypothetical protein